MAGRHRASSHCLSQFMPHSKSPQSPVTKAPAAEPAVHHGSVSAGDERPYSLRLPSHDPSFERTEAAVGSPHAGVLPMKPRTFDPRAVCACFVLALAFALAAPAQATSSIVAPHSRPRTHCACGDSSAWSTRAANSRAAVMCAGQLASERACRAGHGAGRRAGAGRPRGPSGRRDRSGTARRRRRRRTRGRGALAGTLRWRP